MPTPKLRIITTLLIPKVQISPDVEFDARFDGDLVGADAPEDFRFFARVEAVDVDELE